MTRVELWASGEIEVEIEGFTHLLDAQEAQELAASLELASRGYDPEDV